MSKRTVKRPYFTMKASEWKRMKPATRRALVEMVKAVIASQTKGPK